MDRPTLATPRAKSASARLASTPSDKPAPMTPTPPASARSRPATARHLPSPAAASSPSGATLGATATTRPASAAVYSAHSPGGTLNNSASGGLTFYQGVSSLSPHRPFSASLSRPGSARWIVPTAAADKLLPVGPGALQALTRRHPEIVRPPKSVVDPRDVEKAHRRQCQQEFDRWLATKPVSPKKSSATVLGDNPSANELREHLLAEKTKRARAAEKAFEQWTKRKEAAMAEAKAKRLAAAAAAAAANLPKTPQGRTGSGRGDGASAASPLSGDEFEFDYL